jgi:hypothetical protein
LLRCYAVKTGAAAAHTPKAVRETITQLQKAARTRNSWFSSADLSLLDEFGAACDFR